MAKPYTENLFVAALIVALCISGLGLTRRLRVIHASAIHEEALSDTNGELVFQGEEGIDVTGNIIRPMPPPSEDLSLIFLLHSSSIENDAAFWRQVKSELPPGRAVRLIAYCDGATCADLVRHTPNAFPFTVLEYGEVTGTQAVVNGDALGGALLASERWLAPKVIMWRTRGSSPSAIIDAVSKL